MAPKTAPVQTATEAPRSTSVVIIGGGIVGVTAALTLAERGVSVTVLEKGRVAGEQSSRNLGWIRKTSRAPKDVPMSLASDALWATMAQRTGVDVGYRQEGILFAAKTEAEMEMHRAWLASVAEYNLDSRMVTDKEIAELVPGGGTSWAGGIYTPSDGYAEPTIAPIAIANAAVAKGAVIVENCAVRTLVRSAGKVRGVVTEKGEISCDHVILAAGLWSRKFLGNMGVSFPTLPLVCYAIRTAPMEGPTHIAVGTPDMSFRKRMDGGFTVCQRGAVGSPLVLDHALLGMKYLPMFKHGRSMLRLSLGREFIEDLKLARHWSPDRMSPFEKVRTMGPRVNTGINAEAMANIKTYWPAFAEIKSAEEWGGTMDITPDSLPVIGGIDGIGGLTLATGFSGHGFGTSPAAGQLAADLVMGVPPIIDPSPYRFDRF
ncbi:NAD(P)/FAD-dependent oxidoreductase [Celeribacter baekdonensis]|uniref:FAD-dependent oxidoreductase n=1 Tax=Celeribacter baekdonensis B30 TaxID=1208323 RepID=K2J2H0_9RHOB|nr:FAD-binding oxidoreductase [Celeribacter baekdonensis]EKE69273.1 FAD-dependent oxidoreductase [Celeribacter baekdonensis B30]